MEKLRSIKEWYEYALKDPDIHACTTMDLSTVNIDHLFSGNNSKKFIRNYFEYLYSDPSSVNPAGKFVDNIERITDFRAQHTVASFLLGIIVKESLTLDVRNWIRVSNSHSSDPSFGFFWSLICLTHDIAYYWERNSKKLLDNYKTVDAFCSVQNIQFNLLKNSSKNSLIKNYYSYCIEYRHKIDHGITGAILIYDALMSFYNNGKQNSSSQICGIRLRKSFPSFCLKIAETIALHNMWRADDRTRDVYQNCHLDELIPDDNATHIINYKDDALLFLLGLIDSIDPIKSFCNTEGSGTRLSVDVVLNGYRLYFTNRTGTKRINIQFQHNAFKDKYLKTIMGLSRWLDVDTATSLDSASIILNPGIKVSVEVEALQAV